MKKALCVAAYTALLLGLAGCTASASEDLMADIRPPQWTPARPMKPSRQAPPILACACSGKA